MSAGMVNDSDNSNAITLLKQRDRSVSGFIVWVRGWADTLIRLYEAILDPLRGHSSAHKGDKTISHSISTINDRIWFNIIALPRGYSGPRQGSVTPIFPMHSSLTLQPMTSLVVWRSVRRSRRRRCFGALNRIDALAQ